MKKNTRYHATRLKPLVQIIANIVKKNPSIADDPDYLMATIAANIPNFQRKDRCVNCNASMQEYVYEFSVLDALLLNAMAKQVQRNLGMLETFTEANKIHIQSLRDASYTLMARTGYASKLGLIAKVLKDGKHVRGMWAITSRGWEALRGMPVQKWVVVFRGAILERSEETVTMPSLFVEYVKRQEGAGKAYRRDVDDYEPNEWVQLAGIHEGDII